MQQKYRGLPEAPKPQLGAIGIFRVRTPTTAFGNAAERQIAQRNDFLKRNRMRKVFSGAPRRNRTGTPEGTGF